MVPYETPKNRTTPARADESDVDMGKQNAPLSQAQKSNDRATAKKIVPPTR